MFENALIRRTPMSTTTRDPFFSMVDRLFNETFLPTTGTGSWAPAADIREDEEAFVATVELPGLTKDDVDITLDNNVLTLRGERSLAHAENKDSYHRIERSYGQFQRSFALPTGTDGAKVSALFADGLLTLTIPKAETAKVRKIAIA